MRVRMWVMFFLVALAAAVSFSKTPAASAAGTFDELGYNRTARIFNGLADGTDGVLDGLLWGDATYANDKLNMKWTAEWDRGNAEGWTGSYPGAWISNQWNGKVTGGSGEVWKYKIKWIGADGEVPDGAYRIWGSFAVIMSHGTVANEHFWDAHSNPSGFGGPGS